MKRLLIALAAATGCAHAPPHIDGGAGAPTRANEYWIPSARVAAEISRSVKAEPPVPIPAASTLTLASIVDLALRNNPATRASWTTARAAADVYGASQASLFPLVTGAVNATRTKTATQANGIERTTYGPSVSLSYLVLDLGGRSGTVDAARFAAVSADYAHNSAIQNTILQTESAAFTFLATLALRDAQRATVDEAAANLAAADERHRVGLATIADVLQARTAHAQSQLDLESLEGQLSVTRGGLSVAMGLAPDTPLPIPAVPAPDTNTVVNVSQSADSIVALAFANRPDLAAVQADAARAAAQVRVAQSSLWPSLALSSSYGYVGSDRENFAGRNYTVNLGVAIPLFSGSSTKYQSRAAAELAQAAEARVAQTKQQIALQVFVSWYAMQTATRRVLTSAQVLASAEESEQVARGRYTEGVGSIVDLLIAQSTLANARAQSIGARWQWRASLAQLAHDAGVLTIRGDAGVPLGNVGAAR